SCCRSTVPRSIVVFPLSLHDALPICGGRGGGGELAARPISRQGVPHHVVSQREHGWARRDQHCTVAARGSGSGTGIVSDKDTLLDRKSTRLNSSHVSISYAVFCLKKK